MPGNDTWRQAASMMGGLRAALADGFVHYTADIGQASAPLGMQCGALTSPGFFCRHDLFQDKRATVVCFDILLDVIGRVFETVTNEIGQSVASFVGDQGVEAIVTAPPSSRENARKPPEQSSGYSSLG